jgi:heparin binding hemagglutinin HbhA
MTATQTVKSYGETAAKLYKTQLLATIGAGDLAVERAKTVVGQLRSRAETLPGEAQVQADLAVKEARTRAGEAVDRGRTAAQQLAAAVRPETVFGTVTGLVEQARAQATQTVDSLAARGAGVVEELRRQPGFRRVARRAENAVDVVEGNVAETLQESAQVVAEASDEVTSIAQKTAAKATKAAAKAEQKVEKAAAKTEEKVEAAATPEPAKTPRKTTPAARKAAPAKTSARVTRARTAKPADPTAVPVKRTR